MNKLFELFVRCTFMLCLLSSCSTEKGKIKDEDRNHEVINVDTNCLQMWNNDLLEFSILNYDSIIDTLASYSKYILGEDVYGLDLNEKVQVYIKNSFFSMEEKLSTKQWIVDTTNIRNGNSSEFMEEVVVPMQLQWDHLFCLEDFSYPFIRGKGFTISYEIHPCIKSWDEDYVISKYLRFGAAIPHYIAKDAKSFVSNMMVRKCTVKLSVIINLFIEGWSGSNEYYLIELEDKANLFHEHFGVIK